LFSFAQSSIISEGEVSDQEGVVQRSLGLTGLNFVKESLLFRSKGQGVILGYTLIFDS